MSALDRSERPGSGPIRHFDFPEVDRRTLPNGLDLRVARISRLPVVTVNLFVRAGEQALPEENAGLSVLAGQALEGGTKWRSGTELAESLERIGARLSVSTGWEGTSVSLSCLADRLEEGLPLLVETILEPSFPEEEVDRSREQQLAAIRQRAMDPASLANDAAPRRYFAQGTPYARPVAGTLDSVADLTRDDLREYAESSYRPGNGGGLVVVGDVDPAEAEKLAIDCLGSWTGDPQDGFDFDVGAATAERRVLIVHRPGAVQSEIRVGHVGLDRSTPDYFPISVANMLLGGTFTSRLNLNLREQHGFTYGVRSRFAFRSQRGPFEVSTAVANDVTADAVREIVSELQGLAQDGASSEEVSATRDFAAGIFGLQLETVGQIATRLTQSIVFGLPDDYYHRYRDSIRGVTVEEVSTAARSHIRPDEVQIVVVGDADEVRESLEALALGPVEVAEPS